MNSKNKTKLKFVYAKQDLSPKLAADFTREAMPKILSLCETEYTLLSICTLYSTHKQGYSNPKRKNSSQKLSFTAPRGNHDACHQTIEVSLHL